MRQTVEKRNTIFERKQSANRAHELDVTRSAVETSRAIFAPGTMFTAEQVHAAIIEQAQFYPGLKGIADLKATSVTRSLNLYVNQHRNELIVLSGSRFIWSIQE
jgi:hypothetical protein